jgi:hypothetical protein
VFIHFKATIFAKHLMTKGQGTKLLKSFKN